MGVFTSNRRSTKNVSSSGDGGKAEKPTVYVWLAKPEKAIFIIVGEPKESRYSYGLPIKPLYGKYRSTKDNKVYDADELRGHNVVLNVPKDADINAIKGKKVAVVGFDKDEVFLEEVEDEEDAGGEG
jgi:hypothetical protein